MRVETELYTQPCTGSVEGTEDRNGVVETQRSGSLKLMYLHIGL